MCTSSGSLGSARSDLFRSFALLVCLSVLVLTPYQALALDPAGLNVTKTCKQRRLSARQRAVCAKFSEKRRDYSSSLQQLFAKTKKIPNFTGFGGVTISGEQMFSQIFALLSSQFRLLSSTARPLNKLVKNVYREMNARPAPAAKALMLAAAAAPTVTYLSDLTPTGATNGWGPYERDKSVGNSGSGDGRPLTLNGTIYSKGLGVHAASKLTYSTSALAASCGQLRLLSYVGIDDEVGALGSATFEVWSGSTKLYSSGVMNGTTPTKELVLDLSSSASIDLVLTTGNDANKDFDHGDWAGARFECAPKQTSVNLNALTWSSAVNGWGPPEINMTNGGQGQGDGRPFKIAGQSFDTGLGLNARAEITYALNGQAVSAQGAVGIDDDEMPACPGSAVFRIVADGRELFNSGRRSGGNPAVPFSVNLTGVNQLKLFVDDGRDNNYCDHGGFVDTVIGCSAQGCPTSGAVPTPTATAVVTATPTVPPQCSGANCYHPPMQIPSNAKYITHSDFGAVPNDGRDDFAALKKAADAAGAGGAVAIVGGTFDIGNGPTLPADRKYLCANAVLRGRGTGGFMLKLSGDNVTFQGCVFEGGGLYFEKTGGYNTNIDVSWNVFRLDTGGENPNGITANSGLRTSYVTNNYFTSVNYHAAFAIYGYNRDRLTVANNEAVNLPAFAHIDSFNSGDRDSVFEQNYMSGLKGMGMELQGWGINTIVQDNVFEHPNLSTDFHTNDNSMAYSIIMDKSVGSIIRRNTVIAPERPDGTGCRIGFEVGGDNTVVEQNYVNGVNHVLAANDGAGTTSVLLRNNKFMNFLQGIGGNRPGAISYQGSNDASTTLSWDINRRKPGIGFRY